MNRMTPLLGLALLGLAPPALAADIDEVATSELSVPAAFDEAPDGTRHLARVTRSTTVQHRPGGATRTVQTTAVRSRPPVVVHSRPGPVRPVVVHRPVTRPVVVHSAPSRTVVVHRSQPRQVVYVAPPVQTVHYVSPAPTHVTYVDEVVEAPVQVQEVAPAAVVDRVEEPRPGIDRADTLAIGVMGGSLLSTSPVSGRLYGDPGLGVVGRYRPAETVGLQLGLSHHSASFSFDEKRSQTQGGGQVMLFAYPWTRVSPYALGGITFNASNVQGQLSESDTLQAVDGQWGLHGGLGVELALGNNFAIDFEGKYVGWLDERYEGEAPGAFQATAGLLYHFK